MAIQLQLRRGDTAANDGFTGASGEVTVNTDNSALRVHDGSTAGGVEIALSSQIDSLLDKSVAGAADVTLTAGEAAATNHEYTGILTGNIAVIVPATAHNFTAENLTTGAYTLTVKTAAGTGILVPQGDTIQLYCNGTNVEDSNSAKVDKSGATFTGPVLFDTVADIASATSIDLTAYGSGFIATVTGTTPTTTFVMSDGQFGTLVAAGAWPLTYHATTNKLVGGADVTAYAGQYFRVSKTGGVVSCEPIAPTPIRFSVSEVAGGQSIATATFTKVTFDTEEYDDGGKFASSRFTPVKLGSYQLSASIQFSTGTTAPRVICAIYKNGSLYRATEVGVIASSTAVQTAHISIPCRVEAATDYFEVYAYQSSGGARTITGAANATWFAGVEI